MKYNFVIDAGGYLGNTAFEFSKKGNPKIVIFEPVPEFAAYCRRRFANNPKITVEEKAIGKENGETTLYLHEDGTSTDKKWAENRVSVKVPVIKLSDYIKGEVGLLKLNIEGGEYDVIDDLAANGLLGNIREITVQFHKIEGWEEKYKKAVQLLELSHKKIKGDFIWEYWIKK